MRLSGLLHRLGVELRGALGLGPARPPKLEHAPARDRLAALTRAERSALVLARFLTPNARAFAKVAAERLLERMSTADRDAVLARLTVAQRAELVTALQRGATRPSHEMIVDRVILSTRGRELTALKNLIDGGMNRYDLQKLVYDDVDDPTRRQTLLRHIADEARALGQVAGTKVLSDIDDTLKCWRDVRYPKGSIYPGARTFLRELARGHREQRAPATDVGLLTARPGNLPGEPEEELLESMRRQGFGKTFALMGDTFHFVWPTRLAKKKLENFAQYGPLFPEYGKVFVGDSGQGDILVGQGMLRAPSSGVVGIFIHAVDWGDGGLTTVRRTELAAAGIHVFDNYVEAARRAFELGLMDARGVEAVIAASSRELAELRFEDPEVGRARELELVEAARAAAQRITRARSGVQA